VGQNVDDTTTGRQGCLAVPRRGRREVEGAQAAALHDLASPGPRAAAAGGDGSEHVICRELQLLCSPHGDEES